MTRIVEVETIVGPLAFRWDDDATGIDAEGVEHQGAVVRAAFMRARDLETPEDEYIDADAATGGLRAAVDAVRAWNSGRNLDACGVVPLAQIGSAFRQRCWQALRTSRAGEVLTYGELAELAGSPGASRAAGGAMANNAVAPFVPCHRVVPAGGGLGHYSAARGSVTKATLLAHEGVILG